MPYNKPNSSRVRAAADRERKKSEERKALGLDHTKAFRSGHPSKAKNTGLTKRETTTGKKVLYPGMEPATREYPKGDTAVMPTQRFDETWSEYLHRVSTGCP